VKENKENIDRSAVDKQSKAFFTDGTFNWEKSTADIWTNFEAKIDAQPKGRFIILKYTKWMVAASILILFSVGSFLRFYTIRVESSAGQHLVAELPDHSKVNLNAQTSISYHPYWWKINRLIELDGEAYFEVEKGKKFTVISTNGITQVLGTSFNIFARDAIYKVTCITGSVKVKSVNGSEAVIKPNGRAEINSQGQVEVFANIETYPEISWKKNIFLFTASPVHLVFAEIERQYGVKIQAPVGNSSLYTGNFSKDQGVEEVLNYVCPALGLKYIRKTAVEYLISYENE
jgi:ferric-dicitrate binding protein FerR (iron transport regulator)